MKKVKYSEQIYVQREQDGDSSYLLANDVPEDVNDGEVAIYKLVKVGKKFTDTRIEFK